MIVKPCPRCGREPKINECVSYKTPIRKYMVHCPNYCTVLKNTDTEWDTWWYIIVECESVSHNDMYKLWNEHLIEVEI